MLLSEHADPKVRVECQRCSIKVQYDKAEMLAAGGDRMMTYLLSEIARKHGCQRKPGDWSKACGAVYVPNNHGSSSAR